MMDESTLFDFLSKVVLPLAVLASAFFAWKQWNIAKVKEKHEKYDRRHAIYQSAYKLIGSVAIGRRPTQQEEVEYLNVIEDAKWLLDPKIDQYLRDKIWGMVVDLGTLHGQAGDQPKKPPEFYSEEARMVQAIRDQRGVLDDMFSKYLNISKH